MKHSYLMVSLCWQTSFVEAQFQLKTKSCLTCLVFSSSVTLTVHNTSGENLKNIRTVCISLFYFSEHHMCTNFHQSVKFRVEICCPYMLSHVFHYNMVFKKQKKQNKERLLEVLTDMLLTEEYKVSPHVLAIFLACVCA